MHRAQPPADEATGLVLTRRDLEVLSHRAAAEHEELALFPGWCVVECRFGTGMVELAMAPDSMTGFLSWLEASPPGSHLADFG